MNYAQALRLRLDSTQPDVISVVGGGGKSSTVFRIGLDLAASGRRAIITHTARIAAFQTRWAPAMVVANTGEGEDAGAGEIPWEELARALDAHGVCLLTGPQVNDRRAGLAPQAIDRLVRRASELGVQAITVEADGSKMRPVKAPAEHEPVLADATTLLCPVLGLDGIGAPIDGRWVHRPEIMRSLLELPEEGEAALTPGMAARLLVHPLGGAKNLPASARLLPLLNKGDAPLRLAYGRVTAQALAERMQPCVITAAGRTAASSRSAVVQPEKADADQDFAATVQGEPVVERWGRVAVVILAAGKSRRMGRPKQVEPVDGEPMIARALSVAGAAGADPLLVVTGAHAALLQPWLDAGRERLGDRLQVVHNPKWEAGQSSSMQAALGALPDDVEAAIFMPIDQPFLDPLLLRRLVRAWRAGADLAAPLAGGELRGAPALFDRKHFAELSVIQGDMGGRAVLRQRRLEVATVPASVDWLRDIDSPDDLT